jgi:hypothetical protein
MKPIITAAKKPVPWWRLSVFFSHFVKVDIGLHVIRKLSMTPPF